MASEMAETFMAALQAAEETRDAGRVADLFSDGAELTNLARKEPRRGRDGAQEFWSEYLEAFRSVRSDFHAVTEGDGRVVLEWTSDGELPTGKPIHYRGVSIFEADAGRVKNFRTYYDTAAFVAPVDAQQAVAVDQSAG